MLLISVAALKYFRGVAKFPAEFIDKNGDLYRVKEDGCVYIHLEQADPVRFTKEGAFLGVLRK